MKKMLTLILAVLVLVSAAGCSQAPAEENTGDTRTITDGAGREVRVPEKVESIVCVGVGALRYTVYMGAQDLVAGIEDYETEPTFSRLYNYVNYDYFSSLPVIGGNGEPYTEEIINVMPQVIVMSAYAHTEADELESKTGIPVVVVPGSDTVLDDNAFKTIEILGELYGLEQRAAELSEYLKNVEADLKERSSAASERPRVYVGGVSFKGIHGFEGTEANYGPFVLLGADNLADSTGQELAFDIDGEQVLSWDPDYIFLDHEGLPLIREDYGKNPEFYNSLTAFKEGKVFSQISFRSYAANLETALVDAYYAGTVIYPEEFSDIDIAEKAGEIYTQLLGSSPYEDLKENGYELEALSFG
ncbi:MAG: ABC transporter substrate-binding protein [Candidatus Limivicinus sp.]|jgi:iron complex transport system substrate-binding protein